jgi:FlaA1/EpsC-like NDP-sugar epimerase
VSGQVVLQGLSRPVRRNRTLIYYLVGDVLILNAALLAAHALIDGQDGTLDQSLKSVWLGSAPLDVVLPFIFLLLFRSYSRVWYLARVSEYAATGLAVTLGYVFAWGVHLMGEGTLASTGGLTLYYLLLAGLAAPAVVFTRAVVRVVQDLMQWRARGVGDATPVRALIHGAGYRTSLFLRQKSFYNAGQDSAEVVGLVSEDSAITGHSVHGIRVVGTRRELPALVTRYRVTVLYLIEEMSDADVEEIRFELQGSGVRLIRWSIVEKEISLPPYA